MQSDSCTIKDIFHTSIGEIFILEFQSEIIPMVGQILKNDDDLKWIVKGIGMNSKFHNPNNKYATSNNPNLTWDCKLTQQNHNEILHKGDTLYLIYKEEY